MTTSLTSLPWFYLLKVLLDILSYNNIMNSLLQLCWVHACKHTRSYQCESTTSCTSTIQHYAWGLLHSIAAWGGNNGWAHNIMIMTMALCSYRQDAFNLDGGVKPVVIMQSNDGTIRCVDCVLYDHSTFHTHNWKTMCVDNSHAHDWEWIKRSRTGY